MWPDLGAVRDGIIFNLLNMIGGILWTLDRIMLMVSSILHWFRVLLVGGGGQDNLLGILMTQLLQGNELLKQLVYLGLMLAFIVMSFTLIARPLIGRFQAVDFQKVILWFFIAVLMFSAGPGMVAGLESTRLGLQEQAHLIASTIQYQNEINRFNNQVVPNTVGDFWLPGQTPGYVPHLFGTAVGSDCSAGCNGLDAAAAFLGAEEGDITGARAEARNTGGYPQALYIRYFTWRDGNEEERAASLRNASDGVMRLLEGLLPAFFSIIEALIFLLFGIAAMVLFISLPVAIPFAFFSLTEVIAASVLRAYLFLVLRTFVVATMMAFLVQMLIIFAERGTVLVFVSIAGLTMLISFQFVHMAAHAVTGALNVIGSAVGSATGMNARQVDPFAAAGRVAGLAALTGVAVATGGGAMVGAATLLHRQGGLRGGGLSAVGSAALHAARVRAGAAVGRTPLGGLQRGYSAVHGYHQQAREHTYQLEAARALLLDRDAEEAAAILMEQKSVSPARKEWATNKVRQWSSLEESRQKYRSEMRRAGMSRLVSRGYSRPGKNASGVSEPLTQPGSLQQGEPATGTAGATLNGVDRAVQTSHSQNEIVLIERSHAKQTPAAGARAAGSAESANNTTNGDNRSQVPASVGGVSAPGQGRPERGKPVVSGDAVVNTIFPFNTNNSDLRPLVRNALLNDNMALGIVAGHLVAYSGAYREDDRRLGSYDVVPATADIPDLLRKGKHVQKSRKSKGFLMAWDPDQATLSRALRGITMWSGSDSQARHQVLSDMRELAGMAMADQVGQGPSIATAHQGKLGHLSTNDRQRLVGILRGGISPESMVRVLEATNDVADRMETGGDEQRLLAEFLDPNGYLDLNSQGVASIASSVAARGGDLRIQTPGGSDAQDQERGQSGQGGRGGEGNETIPPADLALLISAGLGLKRALPWAQVKGGLVQASLLDTPEPVRAVSESLGVPSLRTSMVPIKRFVDTARSIGLSTQDVSTALDVAASARDVGEIIAAIPEKDEATRHTRWRAAGVSREMLPSLERVRSNTLHYAINLSPAGSPEHKTMEHAQELMGTLLTEGVTIRDELNSVPIETYSSHPFTIGGSGSLLSAPVGTATPAQASQPASTETASPPRRVSRPGKGSRPVPRSAGDTALRGNAPAVRGSLGQAPEAGPGSPDITSANGAALAASAVPPAPGAPPAPPATPDDAPNLGEKNGGSHETHQT